ncbi:MAG: hypothetical protein WA418_20495 [Bradyrhizobium sp.]
MFAAEAEAIDSERFDPQLPMSGGMSHAIMTSISRRLPIFLNPVCGILRSNLPTSCAELFEKTWHPRQTTFQQTAS